MKSDEMIRRGAKPLKGLNDNYKSKSNYTTGLSECMNPEICICFECKRMRKEREAANDKR